MTVYCSKCGKKLGILASKYKSEDGSVMCSSCLKEYKREQEELKRREELRRQGELRKQKKENREIMKERISTYLINKDPKIFGYISRLCCEAFWIESFLDKISQKEILELHMDRDIEEYNLYNYQKENFTTLLSDQWDKIQAINQAVLNKAIKERPECVDFIQDNIFDHESYSYDTPPYIEKSHDFLRHCRFKYRDWLHKLKSSKKSRLHISELDEIVENIKICENILDFLDDLEKMYKVVEKMGIEPDYLEILTVFSEVIREIVNKESKAFNEKMDNDLEPFYEEISIKLEKGEDLTEEDLIKEFIKKWNREEYDSWFVSLCISRCCHKFGLTYYDALIEEVKEELEFEEFEEQNLGASPQKQKIEIGDFTELTGYEFEDYLKNLFELLGYTAVQTPSSGDQGADLILSKDDEKIVVQAKKYDGKVPNKAVQEIAAAKNYYDADRAMVVTNSSFTKSAIELAFSNDVELWDGRKLKNVIEDLEKGKR